MEKNLGERFEELLADCEWEFYRWQKAQERLRENRQKEYDRELEHKATVAQNRYTDARRYFVQYLRSRIEE